MSVSIKMMTEPEREIAFGAIAVAYMGIGTAMTRPIRMLILQNLTDVLLKFSTNGIDDWLSLPSNGHIVLDIASNKTIAQGFFFGEGQRFYVRHLVGVPPTTGSANLSTIYGAEL